MAQASLAMNDVAHRIVDLLGRGPMLLQEIAATLGAKPSTVRHALAELTREGVVRCRRSGPFWIYWLDGGRNSTVDPADWELVEGLTVYQVLEEAKRLV